MTTANVIAALRALACAAALLVAGAGAAHADDAAANAGSAEALGARYAELKAALGQNQFRRPLYLESTEGADRVSGEIDALAGHPFSVAGAALDKASQWCDILILHHNTKYCRPFTGNEGTVLHVIIGRKHDQPLDRAFRMELTYRVAARTANYLHVQLHAGKGPLGTSDFRIDLEATSVGESQTFIRLSYAYSYGAVARLGMQAYLNTLGRDKVGFTLVDRDFGGPLQSVGGMRGVVERNTMRYYLAIEAYLGALSLPPAARMEKSLGDWFAATERYPRQLHEMERGDYLVMKRKEYFRQRAEVLS